MRSAGPIPTGAVIALLGFLVAFGAEPDPRRLVVDVPLVQSEVDYLRGARTPITIVLKQATAERIFLEIARTAGIRIGHEGHLDPQARQDVSFDNVPLKVVLTRLSRRFRISYRVDRPDALTVIWEESR